MDSHVKISGWLWTIDGALTLLGAICAIVFIAGGGLVSGDQDSIISSSIVAVCIGGLLLLGGALELIAGIGLLKYKSWARILAIILAIFNLPLFPFGTALGAYTLWVMFNQETQPLFESGV